MRKGVSLLYRRGNRRLENLSNLWIDLNGWKKIRINAPDGGIARRLDLAQNLDYLTLPIAMFLPKVLSLCWIRLGCNCHTATKAKVARDDFVLSRQRRTDEAPNVPQCPENHHWEWLDFSNVPSSQDARLRHQQKGGDRVEIHICLEVVVVWGLPQDWQFWWTSRYNHDTTWIERVNIKTIKGESYLLFISIQLKYINYLKTPRITSQDSIIRHR